MELLGAVAGFAVLMIMFSTIVSGVVEITLRLLAERPALLARAARRFAEGSLLPWVEQNLIERDARREIEEALTDEQKAKPKDEKESLIQRKLETRKSEALEKLVGALVLNPLHDGGGIERRVSSDSWYERRRALGDAGIDALSTYALLQRLAKSDIGKTLGNLGDEALRPLLEDLSRTFERYVAASNELFRKNANLAAIIIAFSLAFATNFDAERVFRALKADSALQEELIAAGEKAYQDHLAQRASEAAVGGSAAPAGELTQPSPPANGDEAQPETEEDRLEAIKEDAEALAKEVNRIVTETDLPLGAGYFPYCVPSISYLKGKPHRDALLEVPAPDDSPRTFALSERKRAAEEELLSAQEECLDDPDQSFLWWFLNVLLAGALISLGGPFWYKVFASASQVVQLGRQLLGGARSETVSPAGAATPQTQTPPEDKVETFRTAIGVSPVGATGPSPTP